jgi:signal transduction histidine kinase
MPDTPLEQNAELHEKIRILSCQYRIAQLSFDDRRDFDNILQTIVDLIPQAFENPPEMAARIRLDEKIYQTPEFEQSTDRSGRNIFIKGDMRGRVEIGRRKKGGSDRGLRSHYSGEEIKIAESSARKVAYMTERKEAQEKKELLQEQLRHADRLATIGQLAAGIAHELNNPLGDILGFAQLASNYPDLPEKVYQDLVKIVKSTLYAREVIKKVLFFSRQTHPREAKTNLNQLIKDWCGFFEFRCAQSNIDIVLEMDEFLPPVTGDPAQLNQVLVNLVVNAIHAMPDGGKLTIKTGVNRDKVTMAVRDTGQGIADAIRDKIFLPFFTTKEVDQGTGLGLSVVYGIVNEHGGTVKFDSRPGAGSTFKIELPIRRQPKA